MATSPRRGSPTCASRSRTGRNFEVMFRPDLLDRDDPTLRAAATRSSRQLHEGVAASGSDADAGPVGLIAAWSLVHGFATLALAGNIPAALGPAEDLAAQVLDAVGWKDPGGG